MFHVFITFVVGLYPLYQFSNLYREAFCLYPCKRVLVKQFRAS